MAEIIVPQKTVEVTFSLEPAYNAIGSLSLLGMAEDFSGLGEWVYRTTKALSPEQLRTNQLVLYDAHVHLADGSWPSFPAWVDDLATRDAIAMRDRALQAWLERVSGVIDGDIPTTSKLLDDRAAYLSLVESFIQITGGVYDSSFWEEMYNLLNDPPARQNLIVTHLRAMWDEVLALEWERNLPMLKESIAAFESLGLGGLTAEEALIRVALRTQIPDKECMSWLADIEHIIFIPSAHNGPYIVRLSSLDDDVERIMFGARIPEGVSVHMPALSRSELLMRLNALADDTRLRILELLGQKGEMGTPDIKAQLELSQSAASRHLEHLTATGYLIARRHQGTNLYQLNPDRIGHTFEAMKEFCQKAR